MSNLERWEVEPFERFHEQHHRGADLLHVLREAVYFIQARPVLIEQFRSEWSAEQFERELNQAEHNSQIAKAEAESGHSLLHAQATILLWGGLEALLSDFLAQWLAKKPEARSCHRSEEPNRPLQPTGDVLNAKGYFETLVEGGVR